MSLGLQPTRAPAPIDLGVLPSNLDGGLARRAAIGLIVLASDQTIEHEFGRLVKADGVACYATRLFNDNDISPETLRAIGPRIAPALDMILPGMPLDVVAFGCTSATVEMGEEAIAAEIHRVRPGVAVTTPITAVMGAFAAFGARRIGLLTPYAPEINAGFVRFLGSRGIETAAMATFDRRDDREAARIDLASIADGVRRLAREEGVDAVFVSCTSLRLAEMVGMLEEEAGVPVTSSVHALAWHCLRLGGIDEPSATGGRLFALPLR